MHSASTPGTDVAERHSRILFTDVATGHLRPFGATDRLLLSSTGAPWGDVLKLEEYRIPPRYETQEYCPSDNGLAMRLSTPGTVEVRIAGERAHYGVVMPGDLNLLSQGVPRWARWEQETELLFLTLAPTFLAAVAAAEAPVECLAFMNRCAFQDAAISHLMWALRAELQAGRPAGRLYGESLATALAVHLLRRYAGHLSAGDIPPGGLPPARLRITLRHSSSRAPVTPPISTCYGSG